MNEQDRQAIDGVFQRLDQLEREGHARDESADTFIRSRMAQQPGAAYYLAQTVVVQEQALHAAQQRIVELERQAAPAPARAGSGLDYSFGRSAGATAGLPANATAGTAPGAVPGAASGLQAGATSGAATAAGAPPAPGTPGGLAGIGERLGFGAKAGEQPNAGAPGAAAPARAGGGFLAGAMQTAMGVAGGMMLGNMLGGLFGGKEANAATPPAEPANQEAAAQGDSAAANDVDNGAQSQDVGWDDGMGMDDGGGFDGGFDDI